LLPLDGSTWSPSRWAKPSTNRPPTTEFVRRGPLAVFCDRPVREADDQIGIEHEGGARRTELILDSKNSILPEDTTGLCTSWAALSVMYITESVNFYVYVLGR
jgi:hypothetical protein